MATVRLWAAEIEEFRADLACVAAPVRDAAGTVLGAVAASAPLGYFTARRDRMLTAVRRAATAIGG